MAFSLRQIRPTMQQNTASVSRKKSTLDLIIQEGRSVRSRTITAMVRRKELSNTLSTNIVPSAEDILIVLFLAIRYGLASSPIRAGIAAMAKNPTS